jgi:hypothetical protein
MLFLNMVCLTVASHQVALPPSGAVRVRGAAPLVRQRRHDDARQRGAAGAAGRFQEMVDDRRDGAP